MGQYSTMDAKIAGLQIGLDSKVESWRAAEAINFGRALFAHSADASDVYHYHNDRVTVTLDADIVSLNSIAWTVVSKGVAYTGTVVYATSHQATMNALVAAIAAAVPGSTVTLSATPFRVFTVDVDGDDPTCALVITLGASQAGVTTAVSTRMTFVGVSLISHKEGGVYALNDAVNVLTEGQAYVTTAAAVNANTPAYVVKAAGATAGLFSATVTSNYDTKAWFRETVGTAGLAALEVRGMN